MYQYLKENLGVKWANFLIGLWYAVLIILVLRYGIKYPQARFKYLEW